MNEPQLNTHSVSKASRYREQEGLVGKGGVVVMYNTDVCGWCDTLRNPEHWRPGCLAIDEAGNQWVSQGGTAQGGAQRWHPLMMDAFPSNTVVDQIATGVMDK